MELKESDSKLLKCLYHDARKPISKIAKETRLSREQISYRINKYLKEGIIRKFVTFFNYSRLGYNAFAVALIKFTKPSYIKEFHKKLEKDSFWISKGLVHNKYDLFIQGIFKEEKEINEYFFNVTKEYSESIEEILIIKPFYNEMYPLKFLGDKSGNNIVIIGGLSGEVKLDEKDKKIMKALGEDGRIKLIDLAKKAGISAELALYKIRRLKKEKIIVGSRIMFDMNKLGYNYSLLQINLKNFSIENQNKLKEFADNNKHVNSITFSLAKPNCFIQLFHKEQSVIKKTIDELKNLFINENISIDVILLNNEGEEVNPLPFF